MSPIGSSDDGMDVDEAPAAKLSKKDSGPSDISDTDLPSGKESEEDEDDLESLERTAELLKAKLAADASDYDEDEGEEESEGEIRSDEEEKSDYMRRFNEICRGGASGESGSAQNDEHLREPIDDSSTAAE
jgi:hypothetical protein